MAQHRVASTKLALARAGLAALVTVFAACQPRAPQPPPPPGPPPSPPAPPAPSASAAVPPAVPTLPPPIVVKEAGLLVPESVLHDVEQDVYLVSNINGGPAERDNNGFISKVSPDGKVIELKFIEGGQKDVKLSAPKGMAIVGDTLYVTDIASVRLFDRKTGKPKGRVGVGGATFLNDLAVSAKGKIFFTDTGLQPAKDGLAPSGSNAVWRIAPGGQATPVLRDPGLGGPNGLVADEEGVWIVSWVGSMYRVTDKGKKESEQKLPKARLDGIVVLPDGSFLVSSWEASAIYRGKPGGEFVPVITDVKSPADIGFDQKRNRVLVPLFTENALQFHSLGPAPAPAGASAAAAVPKPAPAPAASATPPKPAPAPPAPSAAPPPAAAPPAASAAPAKR